MPRAKRVRIIPIPSLLHISRLHGDHDTLVNPTGSARLAQLLAATSAAAGAKSV